MNNPSIDHPGQQVPAPSSVEYLRCAYPECEVVVAARGAAWFFGTARKEFCSRHNTPDKRAGAGGRRSQ